MSSQDTRILGFIGRLLPILIIPILAATPEPAKADYRDRELVMAGDLEKVTRLLDSGADVNSRDNFGLSALMRAAESRRLDMVEFLLSKGADLDARTKVGGTVLMWAALGGSAEVVKFLLDKGAAVNAKDDAGETALIAAVKGSALEVIKLLVNRGADINAKDRTGWAALEWAAAVGRLEVVSLLKERGAKMTLATAATLGDTEAARLLIKKGADVDARDGQGSTALINGAERGNLEVVKLLLERGADVNALTDTGETALSIAVRQDHTEIEVLLRTHGGQTPEALRISKFADRVFRRGDMLLFRLEDGTVVSRSSAPVLPNEKPEGGSDSTEDMPTTYTFKDFIDPWYVVHKQHYQDAGTEFINRITGSVVSVEGIPIFSQDKKRFLTIGNPEESPCNTEIWKLARSGILRLTFRASVWNGSSPSLALGCKYNLL